MKTPQITPSWETGIYTGNGTIAAKARRVQRTHSRGRLTAYGFACGYVESAKASRCDGNVTMYSEHPVYHVRLHGKTSAGDTPVVAWLSFDTLAEARKQFDLWVRNATIQ